MRNITLSADAALFDAARRRALANNSTLNAQFRSWIKEYVGRDRQAFKAMDTVDRLAANLRTGGRQFTRDELNERRRTFWTPTSSFTCLTT